MVFVFKADAAGDLLGQPLLGALGRFPVCGEHDFLIRLPNPQLPQCLVLPELAGMGSAIFNQERSLLHMDRSRSRVQGSPSHANEISNLHRAL